MPTVHPPSPHDISEGTYAPLHHDDLGGSTSTYPSFLASLHQHADSISDNNTSTFGNIAAPPPIPLNTAPPGEFDMLPPIASSHASWHDLHMYAQTHASAHGYALSINTTAKNRSRIKLACVCYGAPKNTHKLTPETRVRKNRVSYKTGCKMWIEGRRAGDGLWVLRVGESAHNHEGRPSEGWAVQRKRTWGLQSSRVGVGGVTAQQERQQQRPSRDDDAQADDNHDALAEIAIKKATHSLERGGRVWKIVELEMLRNVKGATGQGRDRGVSRTMRILEERLPGIRIFKRDIYNIRSQIKRARKAAGQQLGENLSLSDDDAGARSDTEGSLHSHPSLRIPSQARQPSIHNDEDRDRGSFSQIDPSLVAQCNSALKNVQQHKDEGSEADHLRKEVGSLREALEQRTKEVEEKNEENENLRVQLEIALYEKGGVPGE
ncbi:hypothetical protein BU23DRAFT_579526 [Bimuria novae-zelandiae CBS 107.79]|uniref:FAR1 domain-containing protein n=1 Tax=Bimuria novae-zelandiae CBS 107.79 TaxID=1447943 RepID=A0A6A5VCE3_9PLEO|nr:hypothetical protein BU23DRAFT_579526 [Bimuria novae-zelandiae CBS 107.79]